MRVLITGAAGFLGRRLFRALVHKQTLADAAGEQRRLTEIHLADIVDVEPPESEDAAVTVLRGDLADTDFVEQLAAGGYDSIFHLAAYLTMHAEKDPVLAYRVNVEALRAIMEGVEDCPRLVFTSSIAVFGGDLPDTVDNDVAPAPTTTYGTHKAINELLIADYSRHGRVDGRALRLPIVLIRPGEPQPVVSDRVAAIAREPLNGRDTVAALAPETRLPVVSVGAVAAALLRVHDLPAADLPPKRAFNLPALTVRVSDMAASVQRKGGSGQIDFVPDPRMQAIVDGWPRHFVSEHAASLGIGPDADFDAIIDDYMTHRTDH
ncbi:MAG: NAD-dependent epimerase/dehydratase family protein [Gammaproteobacteria bacterium]|nr:NAD-dependent epimerase/dehydratase family protein [Gammaproteobacteria bacterium]